MEKYCIAGEAADDNVLQRMRISCWINKVTDINS